ncbi:MAG: Trk system potassium transporter TrkA [Fusobacteriaceae bacterium]|jgi:trk system potassium uptake protein TrkA|nr:Trk system potassium transporter TrkA [Fusobacteriaceae bacterium]
MKIIITGSGKVGEFLCKELAIEGNDITLIEKESTVLERVLAIADIRGIVGNGADPDILREAEVEDTDIYMGVTHSDEINLISCVIAKKMGARHTIARVRNPDYTSHMDFMKDILSIDHIIVPEHEAALFISKNLEFPHALSVETFADNRVSIVKYQVPGETYLDHLKLSDFKANYFPHILVCIVERGDSVYIPTGNFILTAGDLIYVTGTRQDIHEFYKSFSDKKTDPIRTVFINGGGGLTYYLAERLLAKRFRIKILEKDIHEARKLSNAYGDDIEVILGSGSNKNLLDEEGFEKHDACISLVDDDDENVILSMYANKLGIKKIITKVDETSLLGILGLSGFQSIVTPKKIIADTIVRIARSMMGAQGGNIETLYRLSENRVETIEFKINESSRVIHQPLKDLKLKENILIAWLLRKGEIFFPDGATVMQSGDRVIVITTQKFLDDIDKILQ